MSDELTAADVMQTEVRSVAPKVPVVDLEKLLIGERLGGVPVVEDERLVGIVSRSDIVRHLSHSHASQSIDTEYWWELGGATGATRATGGEPSAGRRLVDQALADLTVADLMVTDVLSVAPDAPVSEVARLMDSRHVHRLLVVEGDALRGLVTSLDLARLLADGRAVARRG